MNPREGVAETTDPLSALKTGVGAEWVVLVDDLVDDLVGDLVGLASTGRCTDRHDGAKEKTGNSPNGEERSDKNKNR